MLFLSLVPADCRRFAQIVLAFAAFLIAPMASTATTLTIGTTALPAGYVNSVYSKSLTATGGSGTGYVWSVTAGTLPAGITLTASTGLLNGTPTAAATSALTFQVKDSLGATASANLTLTVRPALAITTAKLAVGYISSAYSATLTATGGTSTGYVWSIQNSSLPAGIALSTAGVLSGTPTTTGSFAVTFQVKDSLSHVATASLTITIDPALAIKTTAIREAYVGSPYSVALTSSGGSGTGLSWSIISGSLPNGLALSTAGHISGQPTKAGTSTFSVSVKDSAGNTATASLTLIVGPQLIITSSTTLPVGYVGTNYTFTFKATGGSGKGLVWTTKSILPQNMVLSSTGVLSNAPAAADSVTLTVVVTDSANNTASGEFSLVINTRVTKCTNGNQLTALAELHGVYTFTLTRRNLTNGQLFHTIGSFNADGPGIIDDGVMDSNGPDFTAETQNTFTGTYTIGSSGRGRMDITIPATAIGQQTVSESFCFALDSYDKSSGGPPYGASNHAFVIEDDTTNVASSGEFLAQTVNPTNTIMYGSWAFAVAGRAHYPTLLPNGPDPRYSFTGYLSFDGNGNVTAGEYDSNRSLLTNGKYPTPTYVSKVSLLGTYSIPTPSSGTPTGRGTMYLTHNGSDFANFVFYPYGSSGFVVLLVSIPATTTPVYPVWAGVGARRSSTSFSLASLNGSSVASQYFIANPGTSYESEGVGIDVDQWNGSGNFTYSGDRNSASLASTHSGTGTYTVDVNGRFAVMVNGLCAPCGYLSDTNQGFGIYQSAGAAVVSLEAQTVPIGGPFQISSMQGGYSFGSQWYVFQQQQAASGETITNGQGSFTGIFDTNTDGQTNVNLSLTAVETATSSSGVHGRFLDQPNNTIYPYAIYVIDNNNAVAIPLGGSNSETGTLLRFIHQ